MPQPNKNMPQANEISTAEIKYLSELIRIEVSEADIRSLKKDLSNMLDFISQMDAVDVSKFEPLFSPLDGDLKQRAQTPLADDHAHNTALSSTAIKANAPDFRLGHFVVPRVIED